MKPYTMTIVLAAIAAAVFAGACGGGNGSGDSLTLEEYFAELAAMEDRVDAQMEEVYAAYPEDDATLMEDEANLPLLKEIVAGFPPVFNNFLGRLKAMDPPAEVEEAHAAMVAAAENASTLFGSAAEVLEGAQTIDEFEALNAEVDATLEGPMARFDDACIDLGLLAAENDISFDLECTD